MLQFCREKLAAIWQDRFRYGVGIAIGATGVTRHKQGTVFTGNGPMLISVGTSHWPWYMFEWGFVSGQVPSWHVGLLGFTVGMVVEHDINELGEVCGPDFKKYYWFFKGLNHQGKELGEIIKCQVK
jgi:hypothetical protein